VVTYAGAHYVLRINGTFGATAATVSDRWSTGFKLGDVLGTDVPGPGGLSAFLEAIRPSIQTFHTSTAVNSGTMCFLTDLTAARVGTNGKYDPVTQETTRYQYGAPVAGAGAIIHPWNTALVISLRTSFPRGIASNGRTYYPTTALPITPGTGRLATLVVSNFVDAAKVLVNAINNGAAAHLGAGTRVAVVGANGKTGNARTALVTKIRADDRFDSIERRENNLPSNYYSVTIP